jgi:hypothetical protein
MGLATEAPRMRNNERGMALIVATLVVLVVVGIGFVFLNESIFRCRQEFNERMHDDGLRICDAAVEQARRFLYLYRAQGTWTWSDILRYNSGFNAADPVGVQSLWLQRRQAGALVVNGMAERTAQTWPEAPVPPDPRTPSAPATVFGVFTQYGLGAWYMAVHDNDDEPLEGAAQDPLTDTDDMLVVTVTAVLPDGGTRTVEARLRFEPPDFRPQGAILTNGNAQIFGNLTIATAPGVARADVYSNGNITFNGTTVVIEGQASAYGTVSSSPLGVRDGVVSGGPKIKLPNLDPQVYKPLAAYILRSDGTVTDPAGSVLAVGSYYNFTFSSGTWKVVSDRPTPPPRVYYIEGDLDMSGSGSFTATLLVTGNARIRGCGTGWNLGAAAGNVLLITGKDLQTSGTTTLSGIVGCVEQASLTGNTLIQNGSILIQDQKDASDVVTTSSKFSDDSFGGSATIIYPGPVSTFLQNPADTLSLIFTRRLK